MPSQTLYILSGVAMIGLGIVYLRSSELARKFLYSYAGGRWRPSSSEKFEKIGIRIIRFVLGPALIAAGFMLVAKGL